MQLYKDVEQHFGFELPNKYKKFLNSISESIYEIPDTSISLYPASLLIERNNTYDIQSFEPKSIMIGQDGDLGFFIKQGQGESIFELGLGALGSLQMRLKGNDIDDFQTKIKIEYLENDDI